MIYTHMETHEVHIQSLNKRGWGVGSLGSPVEVVGGVPGDILSVELGRKRKGKRQGWLRSVLHPSALRVVPACPHVPECGGCVWQQMDYAAQLRLKQDHLEQLYGKNAPLLPIISSEESWRYRAIRWSLVFRKIGRESDF